MVIPRSPKAVSAFMQTSPFLKMVSSPGSSVLFSAVPLIGNAIPGLAVAASGAPGLMPAAMPMPASGNPLRNLY
jgi:hypothetical protein